MIRTEFGIIEQIDPAKDYSKYEPEKYGCVAIDDDIYINDWWEQLTQINTYFHCLSRPANALARWGVTLIPPESLPALLKIVQGDKRLYLDKNISDLAKKIQKAIQEQKYMIHFGV